MSSGLRLLRRHLTTFPYLFLRKEVIQPHLPIRLPCYDFTPVISPAFGSSLLAVESLTSGVTDSHGVTGRGAFIGAPGNTLWVDNVRLEYPN